MPKHQDFDNQAVMAVLDLLNSAKPHVPRDSYSPFELGGEQVVKWLMAGAVAAFLVLSILAGLVHVGGAFSLIKPVALIAAFASTALALLGLLVQIVCGVAMLVRFQPYADRTRLYECRQDFANVVPLGAFAPDALRRADQWLAFKQNMTEKRQSIIFGGSDKVALFALIASGWAVWEKVGQEAGVLTAYPVIFGIALLVGLAMGGFVNRLVLMRIEYQRGIIQLAQGMPSSDSL